jgi:hypothetical protein
MYIQDPNPGTIRYGLFAVARGPLELARHGRDGGYTWQSMSCGTAQGYEIACLPELAEKEPGVPPDLVSATPFAVLSRLNCAPVGQTLAEFQSMVAQGLAFTEQTAVEEIFSAELFGQSPGLANNANVVDVGPAIDATEALAQLEDAYYQVAGVSGTIHVPHVYAPFLMKDTQLVKENGIWRTAAGSLVSIGQYLGWGPTGVPPAVGTVWLYITGPVTVWRSSQAFISPIEGALDRTTNQVDMLAEREYVVGFSCGPFATQVTLSEGS